MMVYYNNIFSFLKLEKNPALNVFIVSNEISVKI